MATESNELTREQAISQVISSIAMEEVGLSKIIEAESEKIQYALGTLPGSTGPTASLAEVLKVNESVRQTLESVAKSQINTKDKLKEALSTPVMQGPTGPAGPQGPAGGPAGPAGPKGDKGDKGDAGPAGPTGADGAMGPAGPTGADGAMGPAGPTGADGAMGPAGPTGADGAMGPAGPTGADGAMGPAGATGADGAMGPAGPTGTIAKTVIATASNTVTTTDASRQIAVNAFCPNGYQAVGGGARVNPTGQSSGNTNPYLASSRPATANGGAPAAGDTATGWRALAIATDNASYTIDAFVICSPM